MYKKVAKDLDTGMTSLERVLNRSQGNLKLREPYLRILLKAFMKTGDISYLQRVIKNENKKIKKLNFSFENGVLDLSNNKELDNIDFLGGLKFDSLILKKTAVDDLSSLKKKKFKVLDISETDVWEFFTLEGAQIDKLVIGISKASSLWALTKVKIKELQLSRSKEGKLPTSLISYLEKLSVTNSRSVHLPQVQESMLRELDLSGSRLMNPASLLSLKKLKKLTIDKTRLDRSLLNELKRRGVFLVQSSSSLNR